MTADSTYGNTILEIAGTEGPLRVDLREAVSPDQRRLLLDLFGGPFAIITAFNPHGAVASEDANRRRSDRLAAELRRLNEVFRPADGCSPDFSHRERGFAVPLDLDEAVNLAIRYEQEALFWFDGESFELLGALRKGMRASLPIARELVDGL